MENFFKKSLERVQKKMSEEMEGLVPQKKIKTESERALGYQARAGSNDFTTQDDIYTLERKEVLEGELESANSYDGLVTEANIDLLEEKISKMPEGHSLRTDMEIERDQLIARQQHFLAKDDIVSELDRVAEKMDGIEMRAENTENFSKKELGQNPHLN